MLADTHVLLAFACVLFYGLFWRFLLSKKYLGHARGRDKDRQHGHVYRSPGC